MSKATLTFNLPEELYEFTAANNGSGYLAVLQDLDQFLRNKIKYAPESQSDAVTDTFEEVRTKLRELLSDSRLDIWV